MTQSFPRRTSYPDLGLPTGTRSVDAPSLDMVPTRLDAPSAVSGYVRDAAGHASSLPPVDRAPSYDPTAMPALVVEAPTPFDDELWERPRFRKRIRLGLGFAFMVSLLFHSSFLALFTGGTAPGLPDGQEAVAVDIVTQEQLDLLYGNGASEGGKPREVVDADSGTERSQQVPRPSVSQKTPSEAEQKEALNIITSTESADQMKDGHSERVNAAAAAVTPKADKKAPDQGSPKESTPSRKTDPKEKPDSEREDARIKAEPSPLKPGADGGEIRRNASRGGVGTELGPLPPSMKQVLMQLLQKQIELCYASPAGTTANAELPLILINLNKDGSLTQPPKSLRFDRTSGGKALVKAALKAVRQCAPYRMPPRFAPYYEDWKEIRAEFEFAGK